MRPRPCRIPYRPRIEASKRGQTDSSEPPPRPRARRRGRGGRAVIADVLTKPWDVVVIGTGMGGGLAARRLAERGLSVLILERGVAVEAGGGAQSGPGYWEKPLHGVLDGESKAYHGVLGSTVGGTSVNYAGSLERPERHDLDEAPGRPHPTGGWAAGYDAFRPHFETVERIFHVCGEPDPLGAEVHPPLAAPPAPSPGDAALMASFRRRGLHPYRAHLSIRYLPRCAECIGRVCPSRCKSDARTAGVEPALATGRAALLDGCEVTALRGAQGRISHLEARRGGERLTLAARCVVLSAGGLASPRLLLASASEDWPEGCATAYLAARLLGAARIFVGILEDPAVPGNRVVFDAAAPERLAFNYQLTPDLCRRRRIFREMIRTALRGQRTIFLNAKPELNVAHPCGTLRFGDDPRSSVLDPFCRAHGLSNLYVADSSFMPTSNGVNPSLTIAANALRVADRIAATFAALDPLPQPTTFAGGK